MKDKPDVKALAITRYWPIAPINGAFQYTNKLLEDVSKYSDLFVAGVPHAESGEVRFPLVRSTMIGRTLNWLSSKNPLSTALFASGANRRLLRAVLVEQRPHFVIVDHIAAAWVLPLLTKATDRKIVFIAHNAEAMVRSSATEIFRGRNIFKQIANILDKARCARMEKLISEVSDTVICISESDADYFRGLGAQKVIVIRPTLDEAIDTSSYKPLNSTGREVAILGSFNWELKRANLKMFLQAASVPLAASGVRLKVVGWMDEPYLTEFRKRWPDVIFTGFVDKVEQELLEARAGLLIDEAGGGFKLKTLDYARLGIPMFGLTSAVDHLLARQVPPCIAVARTPEQLVKMVIDHIDQISELDAWRNSAASHINEIHSKPNDFHWEEIFAKVETGP